MVVVIQLEIVGSPRRLGYIGGEILYRTKKRKAIGVGVGINQDFLVQNSSEFFDKLHGDGQQCVDPIMLAHSAFWLASDTAGYPHP